MDMNYHIILISALGVYIINMLAKRKKNYNFVKPIRIIHISLEKDGDYF